MFAWTKTSNKGSGDPINARMVIGLNEILEVTKLSSYQKEEIKILLSECSKDIIAAEERALFVINEIEAIESRRELLKSSNSFESMQNIKSAIEFLMHAKLAFRNVSRIIGIIFSVLPGSSRWNKKYKKANFDEIKNDLIATENLPEDSLIIYLLEMHKEWHNLLSNINDETRHPNSIDSCLENYDYNLMPYFHGTKESCFKEDVPLYEFMKCSLEYLLPFCEMLVLASLIEKLPAYIAIIEIPSEHKDPICPKRFRVSLAAHEDMLWQSAFAKLTSRIKAVARSK